MGMFLIRKRLAQSLGCIYDPLGVHLCSLRTCTLSTLWRRVMRGTAPVIICDPQYPWTLRERKKRATAQYQYCCLTLCSLHSVNCCRSLIWWLSNVHVGTTHLFNMCTQTRTHTFPHTIWTQQCVPVSPFHTSLPWGSSWWCHHGGVGVNMEDLSVICACLELSSASLCWCWRSFLELAGFVWHCLWFRYFVVPSVTCCLSSLVQVTSPEPQVVMLQQW